MKRVPAEYRLGWLLVAPAVTAMLVVTAWPVLYAFWLSLFRYDLRFPVWSRNTQDYDVLIYVANWPVARISAWDTLLKARAIENMAYVVGVNRVGTDPKLEYSGHSAVYDALGASLAYLEGNTVRIDYKAVDTSIWEPKPRTY